MESQKPLDEFSQNLNPSRPLVVHHVLVFFVQIKLENFIWFAISKFVNVQFANFLLEISGFRSMPHSK